MSLNGRRVLVTGGAGFIGSALASRLIAGGAEVWVLDNLATGFERNVPAGARWARGDVGDRDFVQRVFEAERFDIVLHLAAQVSNIVSHEDPWLDFRTNVGGTINILEEMKRWKTPRLLYASSMAVYGTPSETPATERAELRPLSPYGVSKLAAEHLVHNFAGRNDLEFTLNVTSLRMFNVYGPNQSLENPYQGVVSVFISNLLANEPITLFGDGEQSRDFVYIDDIADAWLAAIDQPESYGEKINLGAGRELTINRLIDDVLAAFGHDRASRPIVKKPELPGDQRHVRADVSKARRLLGYEPRWTFEEGLRETVGWARRHWCKTAS